MKIIFSPFYDSCAYVESEIMWDTLVAGPSELLEQLELRAGLTRKGVNYGERVLAYAKAMQEADEASKCFYHDSYGKDKLETAEVLLSWRDALVYAGWKPSAGLGTSKLEGFAAVEGEFDSVAYPGEADRWRAVLAVLSARGDACGLQSGGAL